MSTKFETRQDAMAAGYTPAGSPRVIKMHAGREIRLIDSGTGGEHGYAFSICYWGTDASGRRDWVPTTSSQTVELSSEKNRMGKLGACASMFAPGEYERGIQISIEAIDAM